MSQNLNKTEDARAMNFSVNKNVGKVYVCILELIDSLIGRV